MNGHFLQGQVSINTSEMPFVLPGQSPRGGPTGFRPSAPHPWGTSWSLVLAVSVLIGPCLFPSVLCILIRMEPSLSLYPSWTVLGDRAWKKVRDQVHVCLGSPLKARSWPFAFLTKLATACDQLTVYSQLLEAGQSSAVWVGPPA